MIGDNAVAFWSQLVSLGGSLNNLHRWPPIRPCRSVPRPLLLRLYWGESKTGSLFWYALKRACLSPVQCSSLLCTSLLQLQFIYSWSGLLLEAMDSMIRQQSIQCFSYYVNWSMIPTISLTSYLSKSPVFSTFCKSSCSFSMVALAQAVTGSSSGLAIPDPNVYAWSRCPTYRSGRSSGHPRTLKFPAEAWASGPTCPGSGQYNRSKVSVPRMTVHTKLFIKFNPLPQSDQ